MAEARYEVDGQVVCTLREFREANEQLGDDEIKALEALAVGETYLFGGGAWATCPVRRVS